MFQKTIFKPKIKTAPIGAQKLMKALILGDAAKVDHMSDGAAAELSNVNTALAAILGQRKGSPEEKSKAIHIALNNFESYVVEALQTP